MPLFGQRALVVFASDLIPGFDSMPMEQAANIGVDAALVSTVFPSNSRSAGAPMGPLALLTAAYMFIALTLLRGWSAHIYTRAVARALCGPEAALWQESPVSITAQGTRSWRLTHWVRAVLLGFIWFGLTVQIFVGQFMNHDWHLWGAHPFTLLPWAG